MVNNRRLADRWTPGGPCGAPCKLGLGRATRHIPRREAAAEHLALPDASHGLAIAGAVGGGWGGGVRGALDGGVEKGASV